MTDKQKTAYEWAKSHPEYRSIAAGHARELAGLVDELMTALAALKALRDGAVQAVRCKDCKRFGRNFENDTYCSWVGGLTDPEEHDFCSYGERKDGAK